MNNSKFWGTSTVAPQTTSKSPKIGKKLGATGGILLLIAAAAAGIGYWFLARPAISLMEHANILKADSSSITNALKDRDLVTLEKSLDKTDADLKSLREDRDSKFGWAKNLGLFKVSEFYSDSDRFINAGLYATDALREAANVVTPFADAAGLKVKEGQEVPKTEGLMEAFQSWVSLMPQVAGQLDGVITKVAKIGDELKPVNVDKYPETISGTPVKSNIEFVKNTLSKADDYAPDLKQALLIFPRVLGVGTPTKRYMIIMQNNKEIRPTGGFMTNYATFKIQNAMLESDFTSKDMYSIDLTLDAIDATYTFPKAPLAYQKYLRNDRWYARDMNFSPDFPTSMDQFLKFYNMAGTINPVEVKPVDGIFAIDTDVVKELLEVTGPVTVNGVTYTSDNVVLELERIASLELKEQAGRKRVLGELMQQMLKNVFESDKNLWPKLIDKGVDLAMRKHVQVYVFDADAQKLVEKYGIAGRITDPVKGDYLMVASTNLGGDKTNWFVNKEVTSTVEKSGNRWLRTVAIKYTYNQPAAEYAPFEKGFKDWVRVYAPVGSEFVSVDGSEDGTMTDQERDKVWFSGYLELTPGASKTMTFKYYLPDSAITGTQYDLTLQKQGGIDHEKYNIVVAGKTQTIDLNKDTQFTTKL